MRPLATSTVATCVSRSWTYDGFKLDIDFYDNVSQACYNNGRSLIVTTNG